MTQQQIENYRKAAEEGTIPDADNPIFLFSITPNKLLVMGLNKEFSFNELAKMELENRGYNLKGEWVGFKRGRKQEKPRQKKGRRL